MRRKQEQIFSRLEEHEPDPGPMPTAPAIDHEASAKRRASVFPAAPSLKANLSAQTCLGAKEEISEAFWNSFVLITPGTFLMGSRECEIGRGDDEKLHEVTITKPFYIQRVPVTRELWKALMGMEPAFFQAPQEQLPVESVSWNECTEFLRRLNGLKDMGFRLPTEAEWEMACRAETTSAFANGEIGELYCGRDPSLSQMGWYCGNSGRKTRPVGCKNPNGWGLHDMHGNIGEWCRDWYGQYCARPATDPVGPGSGAGKVVRGGSWFASAKNCRSAARFFRPPNSKSNFIGLRLARDC